jgi:hypothetical protein
MIRCTDEIAIERLKKSDIVIFEVHGKIQMDKRNFV